MIATKNARTTCAESASGCRKCQWLPQSHHHENSYLLLAAQNAHVREALIQWLNAANTDFSDWGAVLALPSRQGYLTEEMISLLDRLPEMARQDVKGTFYSGDPEIGARVMSAFIQAEPLTTLLNRAEHEWVREALTDGWLKSVFHGIVSARSGRVLGHEALIRAQNPHTGQLYGAGQIIGAAEGLKLDHVLDQQARKTAIRDAAALQDMAGKLFINFMPNTIYDPEICLRTTMEAAREYGISMSRLVFEVVETEHIPDMKRLQTILDYYRSHGVGTAVDDMGAGYSSLKYLTTLLPDFVKLDRDLVVKAEHHISARTDLDLIIKQAKSLGIQLIAEGIETESQLRLCQEAGADYLQGYLFGLPANPPAVSTSAFGARSAAA